MIIIIFSVLNLAQCQSGPQWSKKSTVVSTAIPPACWYPAKKLNQPAALIGPKPRCAIQGYWHDSTPELHTKGQGPDQRCWQLYIFLFQKTKDETKTEQHEKYQNTKYSTVYNKKGTKTQWMISLCACVYNNNNCTPMQILILPLYYIYTITQTTTTHKMASKRHKTTREEMESNCKETQNNIKERQNEYKNTRNDHNKNTK